jgi:hypothetical protein
MKKIFKVGDKVRVNPAIVRANDNIPPYIRLVNSIIRDSENHTPEVVGINPSSSKSIEIASWSGAAILGGAWVPESACRVVE